jgi:hypothetical protein
MISVAFLIFNRPDCTRRTFAEIRLARPSRLFVIADGPRAGHPTDSISCADARRIVDEGVDWPCDVRRNYSECNLGCAERVARGLDWAFSIADELIVIEDDCLPDQTFFSFCEALLRHYRYDNRVGQICGTPLAVPELKRTSSYVFSKYGPIWGWASWRRAWKYYDLKLRDWPKMRAANGLASVIHSTAELRWRTDLYDSLRVKNPVTWDFQWGYAKLSQSMLSVIPCRNLVANIGFSMEATHTTGGEVSFERQSMEYPLSHPNWILPDPDFESAFSRRFSSSITSRIRRRIAHLRSGR